MPNKTVYFLIDCSGSMHRARADAVNMAMRSIAENAMPQVIAQRSSDTDIYFKVLGFTDAIPERVMLIMDDSTPEDFAKNWKAIPENQFDGGTPTGAAIKAVIDDLNGGLNGDFDPEAVAPVVILISDGEPNGGNPTYEEALAHGTTKQQPDTTRLFRHAIRVAIGINVNDRGRESLKKFGQISSTLKANGIEAYYDCGDNYLDKLAEILVSVTVNASRPN